MKYFFEGMLAGYLVFYVTVTSFLIYEPSKYSIFTFNKPFCQTVKKKNFYPFKFTVQDYKRVMENHSYPIKQPKAKIKIDG